MKIRSSFLASVLAILTFSAAALLLSCGGGAGSTQVQTQNGTGTPHAVNLSWNASASSNVSGYNIYRAVYVSTCGTFAKLNPELDTNTSYTDSTVTDGDAYCYATTAVNASNVESGFSNVVSDIQIPGP